MRARERGLYQRRLLFEQREIWARLPLPVQEKVKELCLKMLLDFRRQEGGKPDV